MSGDLWVIAGVAFELAALRFIAWRVVAARHANDLVSPGSLGAVYHFHDGPMRPLLVASDAAAILNLIQQSRSDARRLAGARDGET